MDLLSDVLRKPETGTLRFLLPSFSMVLPRQRTLALLGLGVIQLMALDEKQTRVVRSPLSSGAGPTTLFSFTFQGLGFRICEWRLRLGKNLF